MASVKAAMAARVEEAVAETEAKAAGLREAREKNVHFSARVVRLAPALPAEGCPKLSLCWPAMRALPAAILLLHATCRTGRPCCMQARAACACYFEKTGVMHAER